MIVRSRTPVACRYHNCYLLLQQYKEGSPPQSKPVVETPSTRTEEKRNKGFDKWLESFKARIHQSITNPHQSSILEEDQEAKDIEPELSTVYVRAESKDDLGPFFDEEKEPFGRLMMEDDHLDDDIGPIFDEEEEPEAVSVLLAVQKLAEDVVDSGTEADHEKDLTTAYASGDIIGSISCDKLVQPFVCKEYDPVKLLRHDVSDQLLVLLGRHGAVGATITNNPPVMLNVPLMLPFENYDKTTKVRLSTNSNGPCETTMVNLNSVGRIAGLSIQQRRRRIKNAFSGNIP
ncbi:hypothetical protein F2Q69_00013287 [Brassica cretica]|uniref:Uncharacterized protein n=1 Tax=Brassica cretica TaxID=69181 RepID=A0A8S9RA08_BRACR|nr:hypothetical protein F2Q69_00013287 [Brassica cretica]